MLSVCVSGYGCTREVWGALGKSRSCLGVAKKTNVPIGWLKTRHTPVSSLSKTFNLVYLTFSMQICLFKSKKRAWSASFSLLLLGGLLAEKSMREISTSPPASTSYC